MINNLTAISSLLLFLFQPHGILWYTYDRPFASNFDPISKEFYRPVTSYIHITILGSSAVESTKACSVCIIRTYTEHESVSVTRIDERWVANAFF